MPQMVLISVVLPVPLGPRSAKFSPRRLSRSMFRSVWKPETQVLDIFDMEMIAGVGATIEASRCRLVLDRGP